MREQEHSGAAGKRKGVGDSRGEAVRAAGFQEACPPLLVQPDHGVDILRDAGTAEKRSGDATDDDPFDLLVSEPGERVGEGRFERQNG